MPNDLLAGDVLVTANGPGPGHAGIAVAELRGNRPRQRKYNEEGTRPKATTIYHATNAEGVTSNVTWLLKSQVYRPTRISLEICVELERIAEEIKASASYGLARVLFKSWSSSSRFTGNARDRLAKYRARLNNDQGVVKNVYCSEFIVLVYQLACNDEHDPLFVNLNAKHTLPSQLAAWLTLQTTTWSLIGTTDGMGSGNMDYIPMGGPL